MDLKIFEGLTINDMEWLKDGSVYNHNFYIYKKYKLLEICDDNYIGEWFLVGDQVIDYIGYINYHYKSDGIVLD